MTAAPTSIITATYNAARFLERTVGCVMAQTLEDFEWVVADDCSKDGTPERLEALGDSRLRVLRREVNGGPSAARNTAIAAARGRLIVLLDHDDVWTSWRLELGYASTNMWVGHPDQPEGARTVLDNPVCRGASLQDTRTWMRGCSFSASTMGIRREVLDRVGWFHEDLWYAQDWELSLRLHLAGERAAMLPEPCGWTVMHPGQLSENPEGIFGDRRRTLQALVGKPPSYEVRRIAEDQLRAWEREEGARRVMLALDAASTDAAGARTLARAALRGRLSPLATTAALACWLSPPVAASARRAVISSRAWRSRFGGVANRW